MKHEEHRTCDVCIEKSKQPTVIKKKITTAELQQRPVAKVRQQQQPSPKQQQQTADSTHPRALFSVRAESKDFLDAQGSELQSFLELLPGVTHAVIFSLTQTAEVHFDMHRTDANSIAQAVATGTLACSLAVLESGSWRDDVQQRVKAMNNHAARMQGNFHGGGWP